jgi:hypothetical protein
MLLAKLQAISPPAFLFQTCNVKQRARRPKLSCVPRPGRTPWQRGAGFKRTGLPCQQPVFSISELFPQEPPRRRRSQKSETQRDPHVPDKLGRANQRANTDRNSRIRNFAVQIKGFTEETCNPLSDRAAFRRRLSRDQARIGQHLKSGICAFAQ